MSDTPEITPEAVDAAVAAALAAIAAAADTHELKTARAAHSAEGSPLARLNAQLRHVPNERKAEFGKLKIYGLANEGVGLVYNDKLVPDAVKAKVDEAKANVVSGELKVDTAFK